MDIIIVDTLLRLYVEEQTCLFQLSVLYDYCLERCLCPSSKHVLASLRNYQEIFHINQDQNQVELSMPFGICRNGKCQQRSEFCSKFHLCYNHFYTNIHCRSSTCPYPHTLTKQSHEHILGPLISLDLDVLTKAFRVYCQSSSYGRPKQTISKSIGRVNNPTQSSTLINGTFSWKRSPSCKNSKIPPLPTDRGLQICWKPEQDIQTHFIEVIFSNPDKSNGGSLQSHQIYQQLGIAYVFYRNPNIADRVVDHGAVMFQSFTFTPRLLHRTLDMRHVCFINFPLETSGIDEVSTPYTKTSVEYYQDDPKLLIVEYDEDVDFSKISSNVRNHPECAGRMIKCVQLHRPETLFIEHDGDYSENAMRKLFDEKRIFHIKTYSYCSYVHFYSHQDLAQSMETAIGNFIRVTPIYTDLYSPDHLNDYFKRRETELQSLDELKSLRDCLDEMQAASTDINTIDAPHSLMYADDYVVTMKSRRFFLAFLDYTQFRVEKECDPLV